MGGYGLLTPMLRLYDKPKPQTEKDRTTEGEAAKAPTEEQKGWKQWTVCQGNGRMICDDLSGK